MKLFENTVGRPSNDIIKKRRKFIFISTGFVMLFIFGMALTMQLNNNISKKKLQGAASKPLSISYELENMDNTNGKDIAYESGKYSFKVYLKNTASKSYYYKWFLYESDNTSGKVAQRYVCKEFNKSIFFKAQIDIDETANNRAGLVKVYSDKDSCEADNKGISIKDVVEKEKIKLSLAKIKVRLVNSNNKIYSLGNNNVVPDYGKYDFKVYLYNYDKLTYYFRMFEYSEVDATGSYKSVGECLAFNKDISKNYSVKIDKNNKNKSFYLKVYNDMTACKLDKSNNIKQKLIYDESYNYVSSSTVSNNYLKIKYDIKSISKTLGTGLKEKSKQASLAYGTYILSNQKKVSSMNKNSDKKYGAYTSNYFDQKNVYDTIKSQLSKGIPVAINVSRNNKSYWVLVVGISSDKDSIKDNISDLIIIDPYNCDEKTCYGNKKVTLYNGILSKREGITGLYATIKNNNRYYSITTWKNPRDAK